VKPEPAPADFHRIRDAARSCLIVGGEQLVGQGRTAHTSFAPLQRRLGRGDAGRAAAAGVRAHSRLELSAELDNSAHRRPIPGAGLLPGGSWHWLLHDAGDDRGHDLADGSTLRRGACPAGEQ
jgi:hypothetical protein